MELNPFGTMIGKFEIELDIEWNLILNYQHDVDFNTLYHGI